MELGKTKDWSAAADCDEALGGLMEAFLEAADNFLGATDETFDLGSLQAPPEIIKGYK